MIQFSDNKQLYGKIYCLNLPIFAQFGGFCVAGMIYCVFVAAGEDTSGNSCESPHLHSSSGPWMDRDGQDVQRRVKNK